MKVKYLGIILVFFLFIGVASAIDAGDVSIDDFKNIKYYNNDTNVSVDNFDFTIPKGYGPIEKLSSSESDNGVTQSYKFFADNDGNVIMICVISGKINLELDAYDTIGNNPQKMTIKNHDGTLLEKDNYYFFVYIEGDSVILIQANDKNLFEDIIA